MKAVFLANPDFNYTNFNLSLMSFLNPAYLWFIPILCIPLIIHILNFRRPEQLAFSSVFFLQELQRTVVRKLKVKELWLLFLRTLVLACILVVFAQPVLDKSEEGIRTENQNTIVLMVETGIGVDRVDENGPVLEQLKRLAIERIRMLPEDAEIYISGTTGNPFIPKANSKKEAIRKVEKLSMDLKASNAGELIKLFSDNGLNQILWFSDKHPQKWDFALNRNQREQKEVLPTQIDLVVAGAVSNANVFIQQVQLENQVIALGKSLTLRVDVSATGIDRMVNLSVRCIVNNEIKGEYQFDLNTGEVKRFNFDLLMDNSGFTEGYIEIQGDPYLSDNLRPFVIEIPEKRHIVVISEQIETDEDLVYMRALFEAANNSKTDVDFTFLNLNTLSLESENEYASIIFLGLKEIPNFLVNKAKEWVAADKGLLILPSVYASLSSYNELFSDLGLSMRYKGFAGSFSSASAVTQIQISDKEHPVLDQLFEVAKKNDIKYDKPTVYSYLTITKTASAFSNAILKTTDDLPLIVEERLQQSKIIVSAIGSGSAWSNFSTNAFFAPFWYKTSLYITTSTNGGLNQHSLGFPVSDKVSAQSQDVFYSVGESFSEKPVLRKRGMSYQTEINSFSLSPSILELRSPSNLIASKGLYLSPQYSEFKHVNEEEIQKIFLQYVKTIHVYDVNTSTKDQILQTVSSAGINFWPILAGLGILLLFLESMVGIWYKTD
ncbi:MAG: hypothetical protein GW823_00795 [Bacteroidetes bacterium]|nr:hypothetical protein [Bacteroidota bacterium]